ncbi:macro domain-containing protein [Streptomyces albogriseolus]|uniref:macro domain-containing protein n=1 Tax=Streptomyces albogriseolus TaxID=1887 RepID=UPI003460A237
MHFSIAFAALAGAVQLVLAVQPVAQLQGMRTLVGIIVLSCLWAIARSLPPNSIERQFKHPSFSVVVKVGDLFDESGGLVVGFTDVFDTSTDDEGIITPRSVQGQLLQRIFRGDASALDAALEAGLRGSPILTSETEESKPRGKRDRYPIGTVVAISSEERKYYCVAYSRMSNDLIARSSVDYLWQSLSNVWSAAALNGQLGPIATPVLGSDLARVSSLGHESLVKMIILSFVAASRVDLVARQLTVVIHSDDADEVNLHEVQAFLNSL